MSRIVTLTTDFGLRDPFVGIMKGVILGIAPDAQIVDLAHEIPPQDIFEAALAIAAAYPYFPAGTVHVVVVDPGVGSDRRALAVQRGGCVFLAPDNGVLSFVMDEPRPERIYSLTDRRFFLSRVGSTFHGRDVFAPVAAHILRGVGLDKLGPPVSDPVILPFPRPVRDANRLVGEVIHVDRFGNLVTNVRTTDMESFPPGRSSVLVGDVRIRGLSRSYSDAAPGSPVAVIGSSGLLEIALNRGDAARSLRLRKGDRIEVVIEEDLIA